MDIYCRQKLNNNRLYDPLHNMINDILHVQYAVQYSKQYSVQYAVQYTVYSIQNNHLCQQLFTKFTSKRKAEINKFYILTYFNSLVDR